MNCTNKNCPAYAKCLAPYRGSRRKATRATYGLGDPITNADRIRAMTDEELADWFYQTQYREGDFCPPKHGWQYCIMADGCRACWLDWLKKEAKE